MVPVRGNPNQGAAPVAFQTVELSEEELAMPNKSFVKFNAIGDRFAGVFCSVAEITNNFGKKQNEYTFKNKEGTHVVSANFDLERRLKKIGLKPGYKVIITYEKDLPSEDPTRSPMRLFKVQFDSTVTAPAAKAPPPKPAADELDDVEF
jgi:hypothetical protein